ncbi:CGNR zinc finger domain-containing protein [Oryzihumus sp.]|uniref:CGNR zinc finger domain-containing protein n=1 Tax=Oryzihumus sp. TaxID=1968903 RepID=UPI002EDBB11A
MTGQVNFDSHVLNLLDVCVRLVNGLTGGASGGLPVEEPRGAGRRGAVVEALSGGGRVTPRVSAPAAEQLAATARRLRVVFEAVEDGQVDAAAGEVNALLRDTGARPQLDRRDGEGWHLHFHGADDSLALGWSAGCAAALALAMGSDLAGRLGVCAAAGCDRVYVDRSRNASKRFCSTACQSRTKAAAFRARR